MTVHSDDAALDGLYAFLAARVGSPLVDGEPMAAAEFRDRYAEADERLIPKLLELLGDLPLEGPERERVLAIIKERRDDMFYALRQALAEPRHDAAVRKQLVALYPAPPAYTLLQQMDDPELGPWAARLLTGPEGAYSGVEGSMKRLLEERRQDLVHPHLAQTAQPLQELVAEWAQHPELRAPLRAAFEELKATGSWPEAAALLASVDA